MWERQVKVLAVKNKVNNKTRHCEVRSNLCVKGRLLTCRSEIASYLAMTIWNVLLKQRDLSPRFRSEK